ncbi:pantoate--beta-alanine ligase [Dioscorea cayenensis subsp. rotundata]|uniref:Pantoate--beta-alanine ligase n=1 Tax=Dioscorea cayennensis subsp. rotundata TaxID=55577 RepID=A0AB40APH0_DIOCR|nr:pantoate--beta-alanine ligase [Dioscorea cayenensis subsp. rotundata]
MEMEKNMEMEMEMEIEVIREASAMRSWSRKHRRAGRNIAFVPTMGFLHEGHLSLIHHAKAYADLIVVSIYVNPGQFSPSEDLSTYPSDFPGDLLKLSRSGIVDAVFCPSNLYDYQHRHHAAEPSAIARPPNDGTAGISCLDDDDDDDGCGHETWIRVGRLEQGLCGKSRPVFFRGVATIVAKLFNIVEPDVAVFGKKDYQQWRIISRMVRDLDFGVKIIGSEIIREADGLAMSSRNVHLSPEERVKALSISKSLFQTKSEAQGGQINCKELKSSVVGKITEAGGRIDYVEIVEQESLKPVEKIESPVVMCIAAWFGKVRLIDNMEIVL